MRRGPDLGDELVERLLARLQLSDRPELTATHDICVEAVRVALAVEGARAIALRLVAVAHHPSLALAVDAYDRILSCAETVEGVLEQVSGTGRRRPWPAEAGRRLAVGPLDHGVGWDQPPRTPLDRA